MFAKILALGALALAAQASPQYSWTWNEIVGSDDGLFHKEVESIRSRSLDTAVLLGELNGLLGQDQVLNDVYNNYLAQYAKDEARSFDQAPKTQFKKSLLEIAEHNLEARKGKYSWTEGVNQFTDMSDEEYSRYLTYTVSLAHFYGITNVTKRAFVAGQDDEPVSWRAKLTDVRDQGQCGSCYAFSAVGQLEANYIIKGGKKMDLSEQQVVDCSDNNGCDGGGLDNTVHYLSEGITLEKNYPYKAKKGTCNKKVKAAGPKNIGGAYSEEDTDLIQFLQSGTVNIAVDAGCKGFKRYKSGILKECTANKNHAVLAVGYNNADGVEYFDVKNSWSAKWGDKGFIKIGRGVAGIGTENVATNVSDE